jgi:hypothetical protein
MKTEIPQPPSSAELLILPDGRILGHNLTPEMASLLSVLNPDDRAMEDRSRCAENSVSSPFQP